MVANPHPIENFQHPPHIQNKFETMGHNIRKILNKIISKLKKHTLLYIIINILTYNIQ